jgi:putative ABC transport system permease protein
MGTMVINIIPQLRSSLRGELLYPEKSRVPSFFLFDIQPEQLEPLQEVLARLDVPLRNVSPMVRATLTEINQQKFSRNTDALVATRESETEQRFRNRGMNLTYRSKLSEDESIVEGLNFSELPSDPPAISLEQRFAKRLAIKIGDTLTFDVQGVPISGKVVNFRKVHWTSFQPNFFIQFAPGALEDAPQTYLASIPKIPLSLQTTLQNKITESLPNVSLVNVSRVVTRILSTVEQMVWALQLMAAVAVAAGLLVLYSIARQQIYERRHETNLLRILGAKSGLIMGLVDREFFVVSFGATFLGALLSLVVSYILSRFLFDGIWIFAWEAPLASCLIVVSVSLGIARLSISHTLKQSPQSILQAG